MVASKSSWCGHDISGLPSLNYLKEEWYLSRLETRLVCLFFSLRRRQQLGYIADGSQEWRPTILRAATHETEREDHDF